MAEDLIPISKTLILVLKLRDVIYYNLEKVISVTETSCYCYYFILTGLIFKFLNNFWLIKTAKSNKTC